MLSGRSDKKCPHDFARGQSGFVEPQAVRTVAVTASTNPIDSAIRFTAVSENGRFRTLARHLKQSAGLLGAACSKPLCGTVTGRFVYGHVSDGSPWPATPAT